MICLHVVAFVVNTSGALQIFFNLLLHILKIRFLKSFVQNLLNIASSPHFPLSFHSDNQITCVKLFRIVSFDSDALFCIYYFSFFSILLLFLKHNIIFLLSL